MAERGKLFELLDFPKFADPGVLNMRADRTALQLRERLNGAGTAPARGLTTRARAASAVPPDRHYDRSARSFAELWLAGYG